VPKAEIDAANRRAAKSLKLAEAAVAAGHSAEAFREALAGWKAVKAYEPNDNESHRLTEALMSVIESTGEAANQKTKAKSSDSDRKTIEFR
jgi:Sec-independent protein translocase protein TatA